LKSFKKEKIPLDDEGNPSYFYTNSTEEGVEMDLELLPDDEVEEEEHFNERRQTLKNQLVQS